MADVHCINCDGEGIARVFFVNHSQRTLRRSLQSCPRCGPHDEDFSLRRPEERVVPPADVLTLQQQGYVLIS